MGEAFITRRGGTGGGGGGPTASDAILTVTVPTGSTVTMTKGGITLTPTMWVQAADPTLDCALFVIGPSLFDAQNAWTVTATLSGDTASDTVMISSNKQYDINIEYAFYLYNQGNTYDSRTGGYTQSHSTGSIATFETDCINIHQVESSMRGALVITNNQFDMSQFKTLFVEYTHSGELASYASFGVRNNQSYTETSFAASASFTTQSNKTIGSVDLSSLSSAYRVGFFDGMGECKIYRVWLERV